MFIRRATAAAALVVTASCGTTVNDGQTQIDITVNDETTIASPTTTEPEDASTTEASYRTPRALPDDAGCTPVDPEILPPGRWFGFVHNATLATIEIDIACRFTGSQADLAAAEDGQTAVDGVHIRNDSLARFELQINAGIGIPDLDADGNEIIPAVQFYPTWVGGVSDETPVWITIDPTRIRTITPAPLPGDEQ